MQKLDDDYSSTRQRTKAEVSQLEERGKHIESDLSYGVNAAQSLSRRASKYDIY